MDECHACGAEMRGRHTHWPYCSGTCSGHQQEIG